MASAAASAIAAAAKMLFGGHGGRSGRRQLRLLLYGLVALSPHLAIVFVAMGSSVPSASAGCARHRLHCIAP